MSFTVHAADHVLSTVREMQRRHPEHDPAEIERWVRAEYQTHDEDRVTAFAPILVTRAVEVRIRRSAPGVPGPPPEPHR
jgi:hypothetical protein